MSSILIFCKDCGKQVPSSEARDQLCVDCRVRRSVGARIKELVPHERQAADLLRRELEVARGQRYTIKGV
jgi:NMD protein affecting ribosome stability and mRNA decay